MIITKMRRCNSYSSRTTNRGTGTDGGAAGGEALGTSMMRDGGFVEGGEPAEYREVTGKIISKEGSVKRGRPRPDNGGVLEMSENLTSSQNSTWREMRRRLEIGS